MTISLIITRQSTKFIVTFFILLLLVPTYAIQLPQIYATSSQSAIQVKTDKPSYAPADAIVISLGLSSGQNISGQNIAVQISDSSGNIIVSRTVTSDNQGKGTLQFRLTDTASGKYTVTTTASIDGTIYNGNTTFDVTKSSITNPQVTIILVQPTDQNGNPVQSYSKSGFGFVKIVVSAQPSTNGLVAVNLFDSELVSLGVGSIKGTIGTNYELVIQYNIPSDATSGSAKIYANVFSDYPSSGGVPLTGESQISVGIGTKTSSTEGFSNSGSTSSTTSGTSIPCTGVNCAQTPGTDPCLRVNMNSLNADPQLAFASCKIEQKYRELGGETGSLGKPTGDVTLASDNVGYVRIYEKGEIYFNPKTNYFDVAYKFSDPHPATDNPCLTPKEKLNADPNFDKASCEIYKKYRLLGEDAGFLGKPADVVKRTQDGVGYFRNYQNGVIYYSPNTGAHEVHGQILQKWNELGKETSYGYPETDEVTLTDGVGKYNHFTGGRTIMWHPDFGAYAVHGSIRDKYAEIGWEQGLGYPISDQISISPNNSLFLQAFQYTNIVLGPSGAFVSYPNSQGRNTPIISTEGTFVNGALLPGIPPSGYSTTGDVPGFDKGACPLEIVFYVYGWTNTLIPGWYHDSIPQYIEKAIQSGNPPNAKQHMIFAKIFGTLDIFNTAKASLISNDYYYPVVGFAWYSDDGWYDSQDDAINNATPLSRFLLDFKNKCMDTDVHIVAHSLGAKVTIYALDTLMKNEEWNNKHYRIQTIHLLGGAVPNISPVIPDIPLLGINFGFGDSIQSEVNQFYNYYNPEDNVLERYYYLGEGFNTALGETGAEIGLSLPSNYHEENVMRELINEDDHLTYRGLLEKGVLVMDGAMDRVVANIRNSD